MRTGTQKPAVWIIETGEPLTLDGGRERKWRATLMGEALHRSGFAVTRFYSSFDHAQKRQRPDGLERFHDGIFYENLYASSYTKNISVKSSKNRVVPD